MLLLAYRMRELQFSSLMVVYEEGNRENALEFWPDMAEGPRMLRAEQEFYSYLQDVFFQTPKAVCCIWQENGVYLSALRLEPYKDGYLLEALETAPEHRRKGMAIALIQAVQGQGSFTKIYSHVGKKNLPSLATHEKCGFRRISEQATYIDGSVDHRACTLLWEKKDG